MRFGNQMTELLTRDNALGWLGCLILVAGAAVAVFANKLSSGHEWLCRLLQGVGITAVVAAIVFLIRVM